MEKFYLTTTLPYVNAAPHIGFALELAQADAIARYHKLLGKEVFFNTGTDEHGAKIAQRAEEEGKTPQEFADENAEKFKKLVKALNVTDDIHFIRTTDADHKAAAREFWKRCAANKNEKGEPDIYKAKYKIKYCTGCELEKTESELTDGRCPIHPNLTIEEREEENYFFRFSRYKQALLDLYKYPDFVVPANRLTEIRNFIEKGPQDFSISRLREKMSWGIPVPGDDSHVMYVWFDALINYISTLGWPEDEAKFGAFWGVSGGPRALQLAGKDNLRQQSAMWQAMLLSAGLPSSRQILIHGFITSGGEKMSKSLGNVVDPMDIIEKYGADALRFWLLHDMPTFEDGDFTWDKFKESYNAHLVNGLGNLTSRIVKMLESYRQEGTTFTFEEGDSKALFTSPSPYSEAMLQYKFKEAMEFLWQRVQSLDRNIDAVKPFELAKTNIQRAYEEVARMALDLSSIAKMLEPFLPETSKQIRQAIVSQKSIKPLFPRIA